MITMQFQNKVVPRSVGSATPAASLEDWLRQFFFLCEAKQKDALRSKAIVK